MKKFLSALLIVVLVLSTACVAFADKDTAAKLEKMVAQANSKIEQYVRKAQKTPVNDVDWLLRKVQETVDKVQEYAASIGATVGCVYTEYVVDGQTVMIDPLYVVNVGGGSGKDKDKKKD